MKYHLSILQILRYCWKTDLKNSRKCAVWQVNKLTDNHYRFKIVSLQDDGTKHIHNCDIYSEDITYEGKLSLCKAIKTSCDCERYKYTFEVSQALRNASDVIYSSGEMPDITNPNLKISVCKHLFTAMVYLVNHNL